MHFCWGAVVAVILSFFFDIANSLLLLLLFITSNWFLSTDTPRKNENDRSTQTDQQVRNGKQEKPCEESKDEGIASFEVEIDSVVNCLVLHKPAEYTLLKSSLQQVFQCAYSQIILPWYNAPEPGDGPPLHGALLQEFNLAVDSVISRAQHTDTCELFVGFIKILTQHLKNTKQKERRKLFSSRAEELAILRTFADALICNLLPSHLQQINFIHCALKEIVALKALETLVKCLSDPDNLNQLVVKCFDAVASQNPAEDNGEMEQQTSPSQEDQQDGKITENPTKTGDNINDDKDKKKGKKIKEHLSKLIKKIKPNKLKKKNQKAVCETDGLSCVGSVQFRSLELQGNDCAEDIEDDSGISHNDSCSEGTELESDFDSLQEDMEFKLSYEMWRVGHWKVTVTHVRPLSSILMRQAAEEEQELCFTMRVEERDDPESLHWEVRKTLADFQALYSCLQKTSDLPSVAGILESKGQSLDEELRERTKVELEAFLREVLSDGSEGLSPEVFQFLCPLEKLLDVDESSEGVWGLLCSLATLLTPMQEEEDSTKEACRVKVPDGPECLDTQKGSHREAQGNRHRETEPGGSVNAPTSNHSSSHGELSIESAEGTRSGDSDSGSRTDLSNRVSSEDISAMAVSDDIIECRALSIEGTGSTDSEGDPGNGDVASGQLSISQPLGADSTEGYCFPFRSRKIKKEIPVPEGSLGIPGAPVQGQAKKDKVEKKDEKQRKKEPNQPNKQDVTKSVFDLLKEMAGNSVLLNMVQTAFKLPMLEGWLNKIFRRLNPTEEKLASYVDMLREKQWPGGRPAGSGVDRTTKEKEETKRRAQELLHLKVSYLNCVLNKSKVDDLFKIFQEYEENEKLVYMLLSFLLRTLMPGDLSLNVKELLWLNNPM
ncbi:uncharacterized protein LOC136759952 isoform X2 [Amia ocellicauda]|uniref:uncharacterized protein LOC136759952 isoform X2 n=1 Tax=Amia ocellicauda TaxID=2972642 RepID=UPI00346482D9